MQAQGQRIELSEQETEFLGKQTPGILQRYLEGDRNSLERTIKAMYDQLGKKVRKERLDVYALALRRWGEANLVPQPEPVLLPTTVMPTAPPTVMPNVVPPPSAPIVKAETDAIAAPVAPVTETRKEEVQNLPLPTAHAWRS